MQHEREEPVRGAQGTDVGDAQTVNAREGTDATTGAEQGIGSGVGAGPDTTAGSIAGHGVGYSGTNDTNADEALTGVQMLSADPEEIEPVHATAQGDRDAWGMPIQPGTGSGVGTAMPPEGAFTIEEGQTVPDPFPDEDPER